MNRISIFSIVILAITATAQAAEREDLPGEPLDRIVAVVNDDVILESELQAETREIAAMVSQQGQQLPPRDILRKQVLERMIAVELQKQYAERAGITISDDRVNQVLQQIAQRNQVTLSELPQFMAKQGVSYPQFRESIREEILLSSVRKRVIEQRVSVSPREIESFMKQQEREGADNRYHISQILVAVPGKASPDEVEAARERAVELRQRILESPASFRDIAVRHSDGQRALEGGDLGWRSSPQLPTIFVEPVLGLEVGEISEPIRSGSGWHLVKLNEKRVNSEEPVVATETHARHILIKPDEVTTPAAAQARLRVLRRRINEGEDFAALAREFSDDSSAAQGGDLGWAPPGRFVPKFQEMVDDLPLGGISEPFETQFGWHIVQVLDRRETDFTETVAENRAYEQIRERKAEEQFPRWLQQQMDNAFIDRRLEE